MDAHGAAVSADGFGLKGPRGWAFRGVSVTAEPGSLIAVEGPSGSGRTCLLLALTGRMKPSEGHAEVGGLRLPRHMAAVRRVSALGPVPGVSDLDPAFTVTEHLRERALLQRRFDGSLRALLRPRAERSAAARSRIEEALETVGLDLDALPKEGRTAVRDLERLEALRLSLALALIGRPRLLALDDTDLKLSDADRAEAWELLRRVAATGPTVLAVCSEAPEDAVRVSMGPSGTEDHAESPTNNSAKDSAGNAAGNSAEAGAEDDSEEGSEEGSDSGSDDGSETRESATKANAAQTAKAARTPKTAATAKTGKGTDTDTTAEADETDTEEGAADALAETGRA
ncbi:ATP-binding cassette domain-containing protein [Streptomyces sp. NPDC000410]|uniref:ATP-binding cassette domain-containing protein n=1 Tax=Streptomyces sp. NPDC000410 TaxID=3154254 RepID=UPI0033231E18